MPPEYVAGSFSALPLPLAQGICDRRQVPFEEHVSANVKKEEKLQETWNGEHQEPGERDP